MSTQEARLRPSKQNARLFCRALLGPFRDDLKQKLCSQLRQRNIAHLVNRNQVVAGPTAQGASQLQLMLGLDQLMSSESEPLGQPGPSQEVAALDLN